MEINRFEKTGREKLSGNIRDCWFWKQRSWGKNEWRIISLCSESVKRLCMNYQWNAKKTQFTEGKLEVFIKPKFLKLHAVMAWMWRQESYCLKSHLNVKHMKSKWRTVLKENLLFNFLSNNSILNFGPKSWSAEWNLRQFWVHSGTPLPTFRIFRACQPNGILYVKCVWGIT